MEKDPDFQDVHSLIFAIDGKNSVLCEFSAKSRQDIAYTVYGDRPSGSTNSHLGYNGELREDMCGWYLLGNGYRAFNPRLMRFHSPDSLSPFGAGGLNAYAYCEGDPVMNSDPTGHGVLTLLGIGLMESNAVDPHLIWNRFGPRSGGGGRLANVTDNLADLNRSRPTRSATTSQPSPGQRARTSAPDYLPPRTGRDAVPPSNDVVRRRAKPAQGVRFNEVTKVNEYRQRMTPEHWTTRADELLALADLNDEVAGISTPARTSRAPAPTSSRRAPKQTPQDKMNAIRKKDKANGDSFL